RRRGGGGSERIEERRAARERQLDDRAARRHGRDRVVDQIKLRARGRLVGILLLEDRPRPAEIARRRALADAARVGPLEAADDVSPAPEQRRPAREADMLLLAVAAER